MGEHLINGEFQSDKYPSTPRGKVPLSCKDMMAQDLLWEYAQRRRVIDPEFSDDLEIALRNAGFVPCPRVQRIIRGGYTRPEVAQIEDIPGSDESDGNAATVRLPRPTHQTTPVPVWADVDEGIADFVRLLNAIPGVRTHSCCQGTIGEGGPEPYGPFVNVSWHDDAAHEALALYDLTVEGTNFGTVRPKKSNI